MEIEQELAKLRQTLSVQCPELLACLCEGASVTDFPPEIKLPVDLMKLYSWSLGFDREATYRMGTVPDTYLFYSYYFECFPVDDTASKLETFDGREFFRIMEDCCGDYFYVAADGKDEFVYYTGEGSDIPIPAFVSMTAFIKTTNELFDSGNMRYELSGNRKNLVMSGSAWNVARAMNETPETREYWSEGFEQEPCSKIPS